MTESLTNELKEYAISHSDPELMRIAMSIQECHRTRLEQCRYEARRAAIRYIGGVVSDYKRGIKRKRRPTDGAICSECYFGSYKQEYGCYWCKRHFRGVGASDYCSEWEEGDHDS